MNDLKQYGEVQRAVLLISGLDVHNYIDQQKDKGETVDLGTNDGIYVKDVDPDGAGAQAGLKEGDVITKLDDRTLTKMSELQEYLANKKPGDKVTITYLRNKKPITKAVTLKNAKGNTEILKQADMDVLGGNFRAITKEQKDELNINYGLEVIKVNNGALKSAGVAKGFIIQKINDGIIKSIEDLQNAVKEASTSKEPVLYIQGVFPTGKKGYYAVPLE